MPLTSLETELPEPVAELPLEEVDPHAAPRGSHRCDAKSELGPTDQELVSRRSCLEYGRQRVGR